MTLYFEDLEPGAMYEVGSYTVSKTEIVTFAEQFDPQPFHVDEEAAKESMFGELVASGLHTLCLSVRLFVMEFVNPDDGLANMGGYGMDELRWHRPVTPGDTLSLQVSVVDKSPSNSHSDRGYVEFERKVFNEEDKIVMSVRLHNIVRRRESDERFH